jgi:TPR repeat protein
MMQKHFFKFSFVCALLAVFCLLASSIVCAQAPVVLNKKGKVVDPEKVYKKFIKDANKGDAYSQKIIGDCFYNATGGVADKNYNMAVDYYRKAADQGYAPAEYCMGFCAEDGIGMGSNPSEAAEWYAKAGEQGIADAQYRVALLYEKGNGVAKDIHLAAQWYEKAAGQGIADAQYRIGYCYEMGSGVAKDYVTAAQWYLKAAEQGHAEAQAGIGKYDYLMQSRSSENPAGAYRWLSKAAETGNAEAQYYLGCCYKEGCGTGKNMQSAAAWYQKSAVQGNALAQYAYGSCLYEGNGVESDQPSAVEWFRKAAEQGNVYAQYALGLCYYKGQGVVKDLSQATRWTKEAAEQGYQQAKALFEEIKKSAAPDWMVKVDGGTFNMGATEEQGDDARDVEKPVHQVTLSDFYIGKYEVTQALWKKTMGTNPSYFKGNDDLPVEGVSWYDCIRFCNALSKSMGYTECYDIEYSKDNNGHENSTVTLLNGGRGGFRLPTEAEWEYAARGGNKSKGYKYSGSNNVGDVAWYSDNSDDDKTHPVGEKSSNELGLYDMSGNVWEWCWDWYGDYSSDSQDNPVGPDNGSVRVLRGGNWFYPSRGCRLSFRLNYSPLNDISFMGFRPVFVP